MSDIKPEQVQPPQNVSKIGAATVFVLLLISGVYKIGYEAGKAETAEELNKQVAYWKEQSGKITEKIVIEYQDRIKEVVKWRAYNVEVIKVVPSVCELPNGWVHVHDRSAQGRNADPARAIDDTPSGIEDVEALGTVVENYATCHENREQLLALQRWIREQEQEILNMNTAEAGNKKNNKNE